MREPGLSSAFLCKQKAVLNPGHNVGNVVYWSKPLELSNHYTTLAYKLLKSNSVNKDFGINR